MRPVPINGGSVAAMNDVSWTAVGAAIGASITGLFAWLVQRAKGGTEIEGKVLDQWEKLTKGWADRLSAVEADFSEYRRETAKEIETIRREHSEEIEKLRRDHSAEIAEIRKAHDAEMATLREQNVELRKQNDGLQRQIAQNSQSTAAMIGDLQKGDGSGK